MADDHLATTIVSTPLDGLGRPAMSSGLKSAIDHAFDGLPGRAARVIVGHEDGVTRAHLAANFGENGWKVAGGLGYEWHEKKPMGYVAIEKIW